MLNSVLTLWVLTRLVIVNWGRGWDSDWDSNWDSFAN